MASDREPKPYYLTPEPAKTKFHKNGAHGHMQGPRGGGAKLDPQIFRPSFPGVSCFPQGPTPIPR